MDPPPNPTPDAALQHSPHQTIQPEQLGYILFCPLSTEAVMPMLFWGLSVCTH